MNPYLGGITGAAGYCPITPPSGLRYQNRIQKYFMCAFLAGKNSKPTKHFVNMLRKTSLLLYYVTSVTKINKYLST